MKRLTFALFAIIFCISSQAQKLNTNNPMLDSAFTLGVWTIDNNTHNGILEAGAGYGGEWTRDASINAWNVVSLFRPEVAEKSLWSVTEDSIRIGHQYWDKIIWAIAAWNHYKVTSNLLFLEKAYSCAKLSMTELEQQCFDKEYNLFMGPAVFQDGIEAYPEPVYDKKKWDDSFVLHHPHSDSIRCLSTNIVYYQAYLALSQMSIVLGNEDQEYLSKAEDLKESILKNFYDKKHHSFYYLIDHKGLCHKYQEGLGISLVLLSHILDEKQAKMMVKHLSLTPYGIPSISPSFPRNSKEKPGRHNMMIWPHINAFYANGCAENNIEDEFYRELFNMATLAMKNGEGNFYEIYTIEGEPSGGWQCGSLWDKKEHQTWCATGYLSLWVRQIFGLNFNEEGFISLSPKGMQDGSECTLSGIQYQGSDITISVSGHGPKMSVTVNGYPTSDTHIYPNLGKVHYHITLSEK
ncbi:MAG: hypothetical protein MJZ71_07790 [Bacteroidales bacterium]|nr:hypothetical protein [Bacteroidales bacterium]